MPLSTPPGPLTTSEIELVRDSFDEVLLDPDRAALLFYDRLFLLAPDTRPLFAADLAEQGRLLIETLAKIVTGLARLDAMRPALADLAIRHVHYGARPRHYAVVGEALIHMIAGFGDTRFGEPTRLAWRHAYDAIAWAMIAAAYPDAAAA